MTYDDRSVKPMSSSLLRAQIGTKLLAGLYDTVPTMMTSAIRLHVDLPGSAASAGPPFAFNIAISPAWCSGIQGARLVGRGKIDIGWLNPSVIPAMALSRPRPLPETAAVAGAGVCFPPTTAWWWRWGAGTASAPWKS